MTFTNFSLEQQIVRSYILLEVLWSVTATKVGKRMEGNDKMG